MKLRNWSWLRNWSCFQPRAREPKNPGGASASHGGMHETYRYGIDPIPQGHQGRPLRSIPVPKAAGPSEVLGARPVLPLKVRKQSTRTPQNPLNAFVENLMNQNISELGDFDKQHLAALKLAYDSLPKDHLPQKLVRAIDKKFRQIESGFSLVLMAQAFEILENPEKYRNPRVSLLVPQFMEVIEGMRKSAEANAPNKEPMPPGPGEHPIIGKRLFERFFDPPGVVGYLDQRAPKDRKRPLTPLVVEHMSPFFKASDGRTLRWPPYAGASNEAYKEYIDELKTPVANFLAKRITREHAGFELNEEKGTIRFHVDGKTVQPLAEKAYEGSAYSIYPVSGGKFLIPQATPTDCSSAAVNMFLLDHGFLSINDDSDKFVSPVTRGRLCDEILELIHDRTGIMPIMFERDLKKMDKTKAFEDFAAQLEKHGSAIFINDAHFSMIDSIRKEKKQFIASMRDPFHGTQMDVKLTKDFLDNTLSVWITAIFLPRFGSEEPKK